MSKLDTILKSLNNPDVIPLSPSMLEVVFHGQLYQKPWKALNPDPSVEYDGHFHYVADANRQNLVYQTEKTYKRATNEQLSHHIAFDVSDYLSPNKTNREKGRFAFQYEDTRIQKNKTNYRRILFFYAEGVSTRTIDNYFGGNKIKESNGVIRAFLNENGNPEGLAYIFDFDTDTYYFASLKNGVPHGFVFAFKAENKEYVFVDAYIYYMGQKTDLLKDYLDQLRDINKQYKLSVISWS